MDCQEFEDELGSSTLVVQLEFHYVPTADQFLFEFKIHQPFKLTLQKQVDYFDIVKADVDFKLFRDTLFLKLWQEYYINDVIIGSKDVDCLNPSFRIFSKNAI